MRLQARLVVLGVALALPCLGLPCTLATTSASTQRCSCCPLDAPCGCCAGPSTPAGQEHPTAPATPPTPEVALPAMVPASAGATVGSLARVGSVDVAQEAGRPSLFLTQCSLRC